MANMCAEIRGYSHHHAQAQEPPLSLLDDYKHKTPVAEPVAIDSAKQWWNSVTQQPQFAQLQRTQNPSGSFTFVTPERGMILLIAAYAHGGDFPTAVRFVSHTRGIHNDDHYGGTVFPGAAFHSGKVEIHVDLREDRLEAQGLPWSWSARENDNSPCARNEARGLAEPHIPINNDAVDVSSRLAIGGAAQQPSVFRDESRNYNDEHDGLTIIRNQEGGGTTVIEPSGDSMMLSMLFQSSCWNYGQLHVGLWDEKPAVCTTLGSVLDEGYMKGVACDSNSSRSGLHTSLQVLGLVMSETWMQWLAQKYSSNEAGLSMRAISALLAIVLFFSLMHFRKVMHLVEPTSFGFSDNGFAPYHVKDSGVEALAAQEPSSYFSPAVRTTSRRAVTTPNTAIVTGMLRTSDGTVSRLVLGDGGGTTSTTTLAAQQSTTFMWSGWKRGHQNGDERNDIKEPLSSVFRALGGYAGGVLGEEREYGIQRWSSVIFTIPGHNKAIDGSP